MSHEPGVEISSGPAPAGGPPAVEIDGLGLPSRGLIVGIPCAMFWTWKWRAVKGVCAGDVLLEKSSGH